MKKENLNKEIIILALEFLLVGCSSSDNVVSEINDNDDNTEIAYMYLSELNASDYVSLCDYSSIIIEVEAPDISDENVQDRINEYLSDYNTYKNSDHTVVENGDTVFIDYSGEDLSGNDISYGSAEDYEVVIGNGVLHDEIEEALIGVSVGETIEVEVSFGEESDPDVAGTSGLFTITVNSIKTITEQDFTDEWVESLDIDGVLTTEEYWNYIYEELKEEYYDEISGEIKETVAYYVYERSEILQDLPESFILRYYNEMVLYYTEYAEDNGYDYEDFLIYYFNAVDIEEADSLLYEDAVEYAEMIITMQAVADTEDLNPDDDALEDYFEIYIEYYGYESNEDLFEDYPEEELREELMCSIVFEYLENNVTIEEV